MEVAMAKVIEFYIPKNFRKPMNSVRELQRGRILELRPQTKSAKLAFSDIGRPKKFTHRERNKGGHHVDAMLCGM
jgi:hypothetical protein